MKRHILAIFAAPACGSGFRCRTFHGDKVQRDLYSAWLALFVTKTSSGEDTLVSSQCLKHWGAMEPLLKEAGSRFNESVSVDSGPLGTVVVTMSKGLCPLARQNASSLEVRQPSVSAALL